MSISTRCRALPVRSLLGESSWVAQVEGKVRRNQCSGSPRFTNFDARLRASPHTSLLGNPSWPAQVESNVHVSRPYQHPGSSQLAGAGREEVMHRSSAFWESPVHFAGCMAGRSPKPAFWETQLAGGGTRFTWHGVNTCCISSSGTSTL